MLNDTLANKRKAFAKAKSIEAAEAEQEEDDSKIKVEYFRTNFSMEQVGHFEQFEKIVKSCILQVYKIIEASIEERLVWDRFNRMYDSYRSLQLIKELSADIRDRVKMLRNER